MILFFKTNHVNTVNMIILDLIKNKGPEDQVNDNQINRILF